MRDRKLLFSPNPMAIINNFLGFFSTLNYTRISFLFVHKIHVQYSGLGFSASAQLPILLSFFHKIRKVKGLGGGKSFMGNVIAI